MIEDPDRWMAALTGWLEEVVEPGQASSPDSAPD
jgi:hypothetical protein